MDKLARSLPLRQNQIKAPVAFVANMPLTHFKAFKDQYYQPMSTALTKHVSKPKFHLIINVVSPTSTIEQRAASLKEKV
jgi:hypothetical protein